MKRFFTQQIALALILGVALSPVMAKSEENKENKNTSAEKVDDKTDEIDVKDDTVVATINDDKLTIGDLRKAYSNLSAEIQEQAPFKQFVNNDAAYRNLLEREITLLLITNKAKEAGFDKRPEVQKKVADCQVAMVQKSYLDDKINQRLTDKVLEEKFEEFKKMMPKGEKQVTLRAILVKDESTAKKVLERIKTNEDFGKIAKEVSIDKHKANGGLINTPLRRNDLQALGFPTEEIMKVKGAVTLQKYFKLADKGYGFFRIDTIEDVKPPQFNDIKQELKAALAPSEAPNVIATELKDAKISRFTPDGKPLKKIKEEASEGLIEEGNPTEDSKAVEDSKPTEEGKVAEDNKKKNK